MACLLIMCVVFCGSELCDGIVTSTLSLSIECCLNLRKTYNEVLRLIIAVRSRHGLDCCGTLH